MSARLVAVEVVAFIILFAHHNLKTMIYNYYYMSARLVAVEVVARIRREHREPRAQLPHVHLPREPAM